ncbi:MAG: hypothetical protein EZS28_030997 [Streblomastix strix]|uniref:Uncharacterized protein n=1 Tax=Streblomastix strix TaxID=222440 RepID=A0A5J4USS4_9EUKA|nr:MAG: hypothetical protein EZS28_030997 [Streblomastix strix]
MMMEFRPTIDLFASRKNRLTKKHCTVNQNKKAVARDAFNISWAREQPIIHPPIPPIWEGQYWLPLFQQMTVSSLNLGPTDLILKNGTIARKSGYVLPPGELLASLICGKEEKNQVKT